LVTESIVDKEKAQVAKTSLEMLISDGNIYSYYGRAAAFPLFPGQAMVYA